LFIIGINLGTNYSVIQYNEVLIITPVDSSVVLYNVCSSTINVLTISSQTNYKYPY